MIVYYILLGYIRIIVSSQICITVTVAFACVKSEPLPVLPFNVMGVIKEVWFFICKTAATPVLEPEFGSKSLGKT